MSIFFKTSEDLRDVTKFSSSYDLKNIAHHLTRVQESLISDIIGPAFLAELLNEYDTDNISDDHVELIKRIQSATATQALYLAVAENNVQMNNGSFQVANDENYMAAPRWRTRDLQESLLSQAGHAFDMLLKHLDENESNYATYLTSEERQEWKNTFIYRPKVANKYLSKRINYWLILNIQPVIKRVARDHIKPILCTELYDELLRKNREREAWGVYEPLKELIQEACINLAMAKSVFTIQFTINDDGAGVIFGRVQKEDVDPQANDNKLHQARKSWENTGSKALSLLASELRLNATNYPLYANSTCYTALKEENPLKHGTKVANFL